MITDKGHLRVVTSEDGAALLNMHSGTITTLNATGAFVWQAVQLGKSENEITDELARVTGTAPESLRSDVVEFVAALKREKLLTCSRGASDEQ